MIGPVSILSLAAVSAAETTSSGKRGLRQPVNWLYPAGIIGVSAFVGFIAGAIPFYFIGKSGSSGGLKKGSSPDANYSFVATGCNVGYIQSANMPEDGLTAPACATTCTTGTTTDGVTAFIATATTGADAQKVCTKCKKDHIPLTAGGCAADACGGGKPVQMKTSLYDKRPAGAHTLADDEKCIAKCPETGACTGAAEATPKMCGAGLAFDKRTVITDETKTCVQSSGAVA